MGNYDEWDTAEPWDRLIRELRGTQAPLVTEIRMGPTLMAHLCRAFTFRPDQPGRPDLRGVPIVEDDNEPEGHISVDADAWGVGLTSSRPISEFATAGPASTWVRRGMPQ
jgi:hypothetical protein